MLSSVNRCDLPAWRLASSEFNDAPEPIRLTGVREANRCLFDKLDHVADQQERGAIFADYMSVRFRLHEWRDQQGNARRNLRHGYVRFLHGWGVDSNSVEGAVLKTWVASRFGIPPRYHRGKLTGQETDADLAFAQDSARGFLRTNAIDAQLDVLYEFCQYELLRRAIPGPRLTLYRGTCDCDDYEVLEKRDRRTKCVNLNNLSSFTSDVECAGQFGPTVWEVRVPLVKIFCFSDLLASGVLRGESEYLVVGGDYWVKEIA